MTKSNFFRPLVPFMAGAALALAACGGSDEPAGSEEPAAQPQVLADIDLQADGHVQYVASGDDIFMVGALSPTMSDAGSRKLSSITMNDVVSTYEKNPQADAATLARLKAAHAGHQDATTQFDVAPPGDFFAGHDTNFGRFISNNCPVGGFIATAHTTFPPQGQVLALPKAVGSYGVAQLISGSGSFTFEVLNGKQVVGTQVVPQGMTGFLSRESGSSARGLTVAVSNGGQVVGLCALQPR